MKKFLLLLIITVLCLSGCSEEHPNKDDSTYREQLVGGYFTVLERWDHSNYIVYANDTKVKYFFKYGGSICGITPLYNADGSLQIYEGE